MSARNEDFLFAQEAQSLGYVTEAQVEEGFLLQKRMAEELHLDERLAVILVKRGWLAEDQARRVYARTEPGGRKDEIQGYRLLERLGRGSMGTVYKAIHLGLNRTVAIKVLRKDLAQDPTQVERLKSEAKLLASLDHPNIVRALDAGESNGFPFVVMEYVEGETLKDRISREGGIPEEQALKITRGLADALERARRMGVVHRDVKPGNVLLTKAGEPKLMDLGLAKGPIDLGLTQHGATVGTPQYISPEQAQDPKRADTRSDIYSLGATLYAMLTGRPPFEGQTLAEIITKVLYETPAPPRALNAGVSPETGYLVERMMLKDPSLRYKTPAEVVADIDVLLSGHSIIPVGFAGNWEGFLLRRRWKQATWMLVGATAVGVAIGIGVGLFTRVGREAKAASAAGRYVERALARSPVEPTDDERLLGEKLARVQAAEAESKHLGVRVPDALVARKRAVELALQEFARWRPVEVAIGGLRRERKYDEAYARADGFARGIPARESPAAQAARTLRDELSNESDVAVEDLRRAAFETSAPGWEGFVAAQDAFEEALASGFVKTTSKYRRVQPFARAADGSLAQIASDVRDLAEEFSAATLTGRVQRRDLRDLLKRFDDRRSTILRAAQTNWPAKEDPSALPWRLVQDRLVLRLDGLLDEIHRQVGATVREEETRLANKARLRNETDVGEALEALRLLARALHEGGFYVLEDEVWLLKEERQKDFDDRRNHAQAAYDALVQDVLRYLREGRSPRELTERIETATADSAANWPALEDMRGLLIVPDALDKIHLGALDQIEGMTDQPRKLSKVKRRDGTEDKEWQIQEVHRVDRALTAAILASRPGSKLGPVERHALAEIALDRLSDLAKGEQKALPPLQEAIVLLSALPERADVDLRPFIKQEQRVLEFLRSAKSEGPMTAYLAGQIEDHRSEQFRREGAAKKAHDRAVEEANAKRYPEASFWLDKLLLADQPEHYTDYFDKNDGKIRGLARVVNSQLSNKNLLGAYPGTRIEMTEGVVKIGFDFESAVQTEVFRHEPGRAWGVIEYFTPDATITPAPASTSKRFHLLRGVEDLQRDKPLSLPSPFDPAERIVVEFDLYTLDSPFFTAIDVDGVQVAVLSADPLSAAYGARFRYPDPIPPLSKGEKPPLYDYFGRGRGVAFHAGPDFGDPPAWEESWRPESAGRAVVEAAEEKKGRDVSGALFAFEPGKRYRVKVERFRGRLTLTVNDKEVLTEQRAEWATRGQKSDREPGFRGNGTSLIQILTWTPQAIDNLEISGTVLERKK